MTPRRQKGRNEQSNGTNRRRLALLARPACWRLVHVEDVDSNRMAYKAPLPSMRREWKILN